MAPATYLYRHMFWKNLQHDMKLSGQSLCHSMVPDARTMKENQDLKGTEPEADL